MPASASSAIAPAQIALSPDVRMIGKVDQGTGPVPLHERKQRCAETGPQALDDRRGIAGDRLVCLSAARCVLVPPDRPLTQAEASTCISSR